MISSTKTIGSKGEIVIPRNIREKNGLEPNSKIQIISTNSGIVILPLKKNFKELSAIFKKTNLDNLNEIENLAFDMMMLK